MDRLKDKVSHCHWIDERNRQGHREGVCRRGSPRSSVCGRREERGCRHREGDRGCRRHCHVPLPRRDEARDRRRASRSTRKPPGERLTQLSTMPLAWRSRMAALTRYPWRIGMPFSRATSAAPSTASRPPCRTSSATAVAPSSTSGPWQPAVAIWDRLPMRARKPVSTCSRNTPPLQYGKENIPLQLRAPGSHHHRGERREGARCTQGHLPGQHRGHALRISRGHCGDVRLPCIG